MSSSGTMFWSAGRMNTAFTWWDIRATFGMSFFIGFWLNPTGFRKFIFKIGRNFLSEVVVIWLCIIASAPLTVADVVSNRSRCAASRTDLCLFISKSMIPFLSRLPRTRDGRSVMPRSFLLAVPQWRHVKIAIELFRQIFPEGNESRSKYAQ